MYCMLEDVLVVVVVPTDLRRNNAQDSQDNGPLLLLVPFFHCMVRLGLAQLDSTRAFLMTQGNQNHLRFDVGFPQISLFCLTAFTLLWNKNFPAVITIQRMQWKRRKQYSLHHRLYIFSDLSVIFAFILVKYWMLLPIYALKVQCVTPYLDLPGRFIEQIWIYSTKFQETAIMC